MKAITLSLPTEPARPVKGAGYSRHVADASLRAFAKAIQAEYFHLAEVALDRRGRDRQWYCSPELAAAYEQAKPLLAGPGKTWCVYSPKPDRHGFFRRRLVRRLHPSHRLWGAGLSVGETRAAKAAGETAAGRFTKAKFHDVIGVDCGACLLFPDAQPGETGLDRAGGSYPLPSGFAFGVPAAGGHYFTLDGDGGYHVAEVQVDAPELLALHPGAFSAGARNVPLTRCGTPHDVTLDLPAGQWRLADSCYGHDFTHAGGPLRVFRVEHTLYLVTVKPQAPAA